MVSSVPGLDTLARAELEFYATDNVDAYHLHLLGTLWHSPATISVRQIANHLAPDIRDYVMRLNGSHRCFGAVRGELSHFLMSRQDLSSLDINYNCVSMLVNGIYDAEAVDLLAMWNKDKRNVRSTNATGVKMADVTFNPAVLVALGIR